LLNLPLVQVPVGWRKRQLTCLLKLGCGTHISHGHVVDCLALDLRTKQYPNPGIYTKFRLEILQLSRLCAYTQLFQICAQKKSSLAVVVAAELGLGTRKANDATTSVIGIDVVAQASRLLSRPIILNVLQARKQSFGPSFMSHNLTNKPLLLLLSVFLGITFLSPSHQPA
jgi:hypothetical protein